MNVRWDRFKFQDIRKAVTPFLLLAFFIRAILPFGYMPDPSAAAKGEFKVVVCTSSGAKVIDAGSSGGPLNNHAPTKHEVCAFSGLSQAVDVPEQAVYPQILAGLSATAPLPVHFELPPSFMGPSLGSRAPPQLI